MAGADVKAIAAASGVAHGTFFFHFPSKEHVLCEMVSREEAQLAAEFASFLEEHRESGLATDRTRRPRGSPRGATRSHPVKELLAIAFFTDAAAQDDWTDHPVIVLLVREINGHEATAQSIPRWTPSTAPRSSSWVSMAS